jgi:hypothetical protein
MKLEFSLLWGWDLEGIARSSPVQEGNYDVEILSAQIIHLTCLIILTGEQIS